MVGLLDSVVLRAGYVVGDGGRAGAERGVCRDPGGDRRAATASLGADMISRYF